MKTSMTAETRTIAPVRVFPYSLGLSLSLLLRPGRDCENHQDPNRVLSPWLKREVERNEETRVPHSFSLSLYPYRAFVRGPSLPDLWRPNIRHYLWPRRPESLPKEALLSSPANISLSPSSLDHIESAKTSIATPRTRGLGREREEEPVSNSSMDTLPSFRRCE